jgi:hypothetical protein
MLHFVSSQIGESFFDNITVCLCSQSCDIALGLPTCALWMPDPDAIIKLFTHEIPTFLGGWGLITIVAASMSSEYFIPCIPT